MAFLLVFFGRKAGGFTGKMSYRVYGHNAIVQDLVQHLDRTFS